MMRSKISMIVVLSAMLLVPLRGVSVRAGISDADVRAELKAAAEAFPDEDAVIVFDRVDTTYKENGSAVTRESVLVLFRKGTASTDYRSLHYEYNPATAHIRFVEAKVYRGEDFEPEEISMSDVVVEKAPGDGIFWNFDTVICPVPRLDDGDALYYCIERRGLNLAYLVSPAGLSASAAGGGDGNGAGIGEKDSAQRAPWDHDYIPPQPGYFMDNVYFQDQWPILEKTYTIEGPRSRPLQFATANGRIEVSVRFTEDRWLYRFSVHDQAPYRAGRMEVSREQGAVRLALAAHPSWEMKSKWAFEHNERQFIISPEMKAMVDRIIEGAKDDDDKMFRLLHWTAENIRYLGLDMGEGEGHMVHPTDEIFRDRAGVCKDKAAVLVSMLRAAGLDAYFVMTLAMEQTVDEIPSDVTFNHGVVAVRRHDGKGWTFLDPTWAPQDRPLFNHLEQEQPVLIAAPEGCGLMHVPYSPPEENPFVITAETSLFMDGSAVTDLFIETDGFIDGRFRYPLAEFNMFQLDRYFQRFVNELAETAELLTLEYSDPGNFYQPVQIHLRARFPEVAADLGDRLLFTPVLMRHPYHKRWESDYLHVPDAGKKDGHSVELICTRHVVFRETVRLPRGYRLDAPPEPVSMKGYTLDFDWSVSESRPGRISFEQTIDIKHRITPPEHRRELAEASRKLRELKDTVLVIRTAEKKKTSNPPEPRLRRKIKDRFTGLQGEEADVFDQHLDLQLKSDGSLAERYVLDVKVSTSGGIEDFADRRYVVNDAFQKVNVHEAYTIRPDGKRIDSPETAVNLTLDDAAPGAPDFRFMKTLTVSLVGVTKESRLISDVERITKDPGPVEYIYRPAETVPVERAELTLTVPESMTPAYEVLGADVSPDMESVPGGKRYRWRFGPLPPIRYESRRTGADPRRPVLILNATGQSWPERLKDLQAVFFEPDPLSEILRTTAEKITKDAVLPADRLDALRDFVQNNIRTVDIEPRRVFYRLRSARRILDTGYGMELERLKLLAALVKAAGGDASLILAGRPDQVSHTVACLPSLRWYYLECRLDGTERLYSGRRSPEPDSGWFRRVRAVIRPSDVQMIWPEPLPKKANRCRMYVKLNIRDDGTLTGNLDLHLDGGFCPAGTFGRKMNQWLDDLAATFADDAEVTGFDLFRWNSEERSAHVAVRFKGKAILDEPVPDIKILLLPVCPEGFFRMDGDIDPYLHRVNDVRVGFTGVETDVLEVEFPKSWRAVSVVRKYDSASKLIRFKRDVKAEDRCIRVERVLDIDKEVIPAGSYPEFLRVWRSFCGETQNRLIFDASKRDGGGGKK